MIHLVWKVRMGVEIKYRCESNLGGMYGKVFSNRGVACKGQDD